MKSSASATCGECGQPASVHVTWVSAGLPQTVAFCEKHAAAAGVLEAQAYALLEDREPAANRPTEATLRCPVCDCSQRDFERQGRFGCPACYGAFAGLLRPMLSRMHRGRQHRGKLPQRGLDPAAVRHRIAQLQAELADSRLTDRQGNASTTRDILAALQAKLLSPPPPGAGT
jgi:protein arginine kinase activator